MELEQLDYPVKLIVEIFWYAMHFSPNKDDLSYTEIGMNLEPFFEEKDIQAAIDILDEHFTCSVKQV